MFTYIYQNTAPAITKAFTYLVSAIKYLDDSKDPFEAGDLIEVRESVEYAEPPQMSAELIAKILSNIKDPEKIANLMQLNRSWYREGSRRLYKDRDELMNWLRLNRIEQLDPFMRYLKLDRIDEYRRINNRIGTIFSSPNSDLTFFSVKLTFFNVELTFFNVELTFFSVKSTFFAICFLLKI